MSAIAGTKSASRLPSAVVAVVVLLGSLLGPCCVDCQRLEVGYLGAVNLIDEREVGVCVRCVSVCVTLCDLFVPTHAIDYGVLSFTVRHCGEHGL